MREVTLQRLLDDLTDRLPGTPEREVLPEPDRDRRLGPEV